MINPYAVMYDATMDVYRYQDATDTEGFNSSEEKMRCIWHKMPI